MRGRATRGTLHLMSTLTHESILDAAEKAIAEAQQARSFHRKRTRVGSSQRNTDIKHAEKKIRLAMRPIRSALGRAPYDELTDENRKRHNELREMSQRVQAERRKLWKLRHGGVKNRGNR